MTLEELDTPLIVVIAIQVMLLLTGVLVLWRIGFSRKGREARHRPSPLTHWQITAWDFAYATFIVLSAAFAIPLMAQVLVGSINVTKETETLILGAGFQLGLLTGAGVAAAAMKQRQIAAGVTQTRSAHLPMNIWLAGVITLLAAIPVLTGVNVAWTYAMDALGFDTTRQELIFIFAKAQNPWAILGLTSLAVVIAPLAEEIVFRAGMFRYLRTRCPDWLAYTLPAAIFALLHGNLVAFGPLFVLGVVFAIAYERTGRIAVPIIAHGLFNLNTVVLLLAGVDV